jgi:uncharacterized membrane-anchored protein
MNSKNIGESRSIYGENRYNLLAKAEKIKGSTVKFKGGTVKYDGENSKFIWGTIIKNLGENSPVEEKNCRCAGE